MDGSSKGWWQASDGRWYPPGMANHPAARRLARPAEPDRTSTTVAATPADPANPAAPADTPGTRRGSWRLWAVLATQMALAVALVVIVVGAPNPRSVETRHRPQTVDATDATTTVPE